MQNTSQFAFARNRIPVPMIAVGIVAGLLASSAFAQTAAVDGSSVTEVRFEGLTSVSTGFVQSVVRTEAGETYDLAAAAEDVERLLATGRFASAEYRVEPTADGVVVVFVVRETARLAELRFVGSKKFSDKKLRSMVPLQVGDSIDTFRAREGADGILSAYRDAGYGQATVTFDDQLLRSTGELLYSIEEGPQIRIRKILFEGAEAYSKADLNRQVTSKTYLWIFRDGKFDEDGVEADAASLQSYYRSQGYLDARASYRLEFDERQRDLTVVFSIVEGTRYSVESVEFDGTSVFSETDLRALMVLGVGDAMLESRLDRSVRAIRERYGESGYIYASVRAVRVFSDDPGFVRITIRIDEGGQYRVGRIVVRGNERTQDKVIRRQLDLFPEEVLNMTKAREAERNLRQTRLFETTSVAAVGDQPDVRDVLVTVEEARKAGDFVFGVGVTSNSGLVGSVILDIRNFDLFDTPRTFEEFIKMRSFYGAGQRLRIEAQPGTELNRFRIDFTEPFLMDKALRFDFSMYFFERGRETYDERRIGASVSFGKRLPRGWFKDWYGELAFRLEGARVSNLDFWAPRDVRDDEGSDLLTSVKTSLVRDRTDSRFVPTRGDRIRLAYEQFGLFGGELFGKLTGSYTRHFTLRIDEQERKSVLSMKATGGYILGDAPVYERFYAGGIGSIRGFQFRGVSPRQGLKDDVIGGELMLLLSAEYSFPLYGEMLRGLMFTDMGTVESDFELTNWRVAIGAGVRMQIDFFGPVPLEFDIAVPVFSDENDEEQVFSFFIGATF